MGEPTSTSIAAGALAACAFHAGAVIVDPVLGMSVDALIVGFVAGLAAQLHLPPTGNKRTPAHVFAFAAVGSFFAGILSPLAAGLAINQWGCPTGMNYELYRLSAAALIGVVVHIGIPVLRPLFARWAKG